MADVSLDASAVLCEQIGATRLLTINRPDRLNAFVPGLIGLLDRALDEAEADDATGALVITGAGEKAFVAGNDVEALSRLTAVAAYQDMLAGQRLFMRLHEFPKPTLAMVNGYALGGGFELALACDFILCASTARFGFPEIQLDTMPGWGGTQFAVRKMGSMRAKEMVLTGRIYEADECSGFGFINRIEAADLLREKTLAFADALTAHHPTALAMAKRAVNRAADVPLQAGLDLEAALYAVNFSAPHAAAGFQRFLARDRTRGRRKPDSK